MIRVTVTSNRFTQLGAQARQRAASLVLDTAHTIEADAKGRAPTDTGALRNSIQTQSTGEMSAEVSVGVEYGIYQEYGTVHMAAQPYLTPAAEAARGPFEAAAKRLFD